MRNDARVHATAIHPFVREVHGVRYQVADVARSIALYTDGYEVARRLRQRPWGHELLVALTGWGQEEHRRLTRAAGFDRHVTKPVTHETIEELLQAAGESR